VDVRRQPEIGEIEERFVALRIDRRAGTSPRSAAGSPTT
jgi:hypothetical protein